jgi:hypothetical protein
MKKGFFENADSANCPEYTRESEWSFTLDPEAM